jgi:hypothetical protein
MGSVEKPMKVIVPLPVLAPPKRKKDKKSQVREDAQALVELALDLGDTPDAIHPQHKQALRTGTHALGKVPAFGPHETEPSNASERHAVRTYKAAVAKLQQYGGVVPRSLRDAPRCAMDMMRTLQDLVRREHAHSEELEQLAVQTVLRLPEFKTLKRALDSGNLKIEAHLGSPDLTSAQTREEEPEEGSPEPEQDRVEAEYNELVSKRKMVNTMIQGAAVSNNYAYAYYARDEINAIDPRLVRDYGKLMAYTELGQFVQGTAIATASAAAHGSVEQGGGARLRREEDGSITVVATGLVFPILVQEVIKGVMEFLSLNDEEDPEVAADVSKRADYIEDEQYQQQIGPSVWREFMDAIGADAAEAMPYVHDELNRMPVSEYNEKMRGLIAGTPEGKRWFSQLAAKVKAEMQSDEAQTEALTMVKRLIT